ncbi:MAG: hypothetical protein WBX00_00340 [Isosphaeraceae bacterium]
MHVQIDEVRKVPRHEFHRLREATGEEVDPVLDLDDLLVNDQLVALVLANVGLETLDCQLGALGRFLLGNGNLAAFS